MGAPANPLCDRDRFAMSRGELMADKMGSIERRAAYLCNNPLCHRCYDESIGYFDFIEGTQFVADRQLLCAGDAYPMYLEAIRPDGNQTWRCPACLRVESF